MFTKSGCGCRGWTMIAARRPGIPTAIPTKNHPPCLDLRSCKVTGKCVAACPVEAMSLVSANDPVKPKMKASRLDESICLGCGVCVTVWPQKGIRLEPRGEWVITPVDSTHKVVRMTIERGMLQDLIFDNRELMSHRAMSAFQERCGWMDRSPAPFTRRASASFSEYGTPPSSGLV